MGTSLGPEDILYGYTDPLGNGGFLEVFFKLRPALCSYPPGIQYGIHADGVYQKF